MGKDLFDNFAAAREVFEAGGRGARIFAFGNVFFRRRGRSAADGEYAAGDPDDVGRGVSRGDGRRICRNRILLRATAWASIRPWSRPVFWILPTRCERSENAARICRKRFRSASGRWRRSSGSISQRSKQACAEAAEGQVCSPANINSPSQVVIAGNTEAVDRACEILKEKGAKRAIKLNVSAPFHCALMMPAQERLADDLAELELRRASIFRSFTMSMRQ